MDWLRKHWITTLFVLALVIGTGYNTEAVSRAESARRAAQADQIHFNLGACGRGHILRVAVNNNIVALRAIQGTLVASLANASQTAVRKDARAGYAKQYRKLATIRLRAVPDPSCAKIVAAQTPRR